MKILKPTRFGNPILRQIAKHLTLEEVKSENIQAFIRDMFYTLRTKKYGVGLAAPQVNKSVAISVIDIKSTPSRPDIEAFSSVIINPEIVKTYGRRTGMWEGCLSCGTGKNIVYAKALRYKQIRLKWYDEHAKLHEQDFVGFTAHVIQHEVDHLNGILFVDRVRDTKTYMMQDEFYKRVVKAGKKR